MHAYSNNRRDKNPSGHGDKSPRQKNAHYTKRDSKPTEWDLRTGGKIPAFAVYFNVAADQLTDIVREHLGDKQFTLDKLIASKTIDHKLAIILRNFLFKGYLLNKNESGTTEVSNTEQTIMLKLIEKLIAMRNFHSHYYHDHSMMTYEPDLAEFIKEAHNQAARSFIEVHPKEVDKYLLNLREFPLFKEDDESGALYITQTGRAFFLSFFLTTGQMSGLLQQMTGSKNNSTPEFRIKHQIFKYYAHRDGATRKYYTHKEKDNSTVFDAEMPIEALKKGISIASYLNDIPELFHDSHRIPIFLDNKRVEGFEELIAFAKAHTSLSSHFNLAIAKKTPKPPKKGKPILAPAPDKEIAIQLTPVQQSEIVYHLRASDFKRLLLELMRNEHDVETNGSTPAVITRLHEHAQERSQLQEALAAGLADYQTEEEKRQELRNWAHYKLRNERLQKRLGMLLEEKKDPELVIEKFRKFMSEESSWPIELVFNHFFSEEDRKPRSENLFMQFAVNYLIDFNLTPDWNWMQQRQGFVEELDDVQANVKHRAPEKTSVHKKLTVFHNTLVDGFALAFTPDGQINIVVKGKYLTLGPTVMRDLLYYHQKHADINSFGVKLAEVLTEGTLDSLPKRAVPQGLQNQKAPVRSRQELKEEAKRVINKRIALLTNYLNNATRLRRADKNRIVMECYKCFKWSYPHDAKFKFLRQSEYKMLSVYHYLLDMNRKQGKKERKYEFLLSGETLSGKMDIRKHMPKRTTALLEDCNLYSDERYYSKPPLPENLKLNSFEYLFKEVISDTIAFLSASEQRFNNQKLSWAEHEAYLNRLGITTDHSSNAWPDTLPFAVHPCLTHHFLGKEQDSAYGKCLAATSRNNVSLTKDLRYDYQLPWLTALWPTDTALTSSHATQSGFAPGGQPFSLRGFKNACVTQLNQDLILWQIAKNYLRKAQQSGNETLQIKEMDWKIASLSKTPIRSRFISIDMKELGLTQTTEKRNYVLSLFFHQLDDQLFVLDKTELELLLKLALKRNSSIAQQKEKYWLVPFDELFKERGRQLAESVHWAGVLLRWEKGICEQDRSLTETKAKAISAVTDADLDDSRLPHLRFPEVLRMAGLSEQNTLYSTLKQLRNNCFHYKIPTLPFAYTQLAQHQDLCNLIGYAPKEKFDYTLPLKQD